LIRLLGVLVAGLLASGCAATTSGSTDALTVYAAASLKNAVEQAATVYETADPGATITLASGSSATLRTQIEQGAPADVFLSADQANAGMLVESGLTDGPAVDVAHTTLTIIVPRADPAGIRTPADLARPGVKVIAAGPDVPITTYAGRVVANLGIAAAYDANVVSREDDVRAVVAKIELGEGDAAIVYATDAAASGKVSTVAIPADANVTTVSAGVVVKSSRHVAAAHAFLAWLAGADGRAEMARFGFEPAP
jgi:molybdate transport system substrate-binding protein